MPHHLRLDLHLVELLARINTNDTTNHLRDNDHVPQVRLNEVGLLVGLGLLFGFAKLLNEAEGTSAQTPVEAATGTGMNNVTKLFGGKVEKAGVIRGWCLRG